MRRIYQGWSVVLTAALFFMYEFFQINIFNVLEKELVIAFETTAASIGYVSSSYFYGTILLLIPAGLILDKLSTRHIILFALGMTIVGNTLFAYASTLPIAAFGRFTVGFCAGPFALISVIKLATRWFDKSMLSLASGLAISIGMLGGILAQSPFQTLVQELGWRAALLVNSGAGCLLWLVIFLMVKDGPGEQKVDTHQSHLSLLTRIKLVASKRENWAVGLYAGLTNLPIFVLGSLFSSLFLTQYHGLSTVQASTATMLIFLGMLIGAPFYGWLSGRIQCRKYPMIAGALLSCCMISTLLIGQFSLIGIMTCYFFMGFGSAAHTLTYSFIAEVNDWSVTASAESLAAVCIMLGGAIFQPLVGYLLDKYWDGHIVQGIPNYPELSFQVAVGLIPIGLIVAVLLMLPLRDSYKR